MTRKRNRGAWLAACLAAVALAACTYRPEYRDEPIQRSFSWFSYLNADDLRAYCRGGTEPDRYRIVFNAPRQRQVRTYDVTGARDGSGADLVAQISGNFDFTRAIPIEDLLKPWRSTIAHKRIGAADFRDLRAALQASGFDTPPPEGTRVTSDDFFWLVAACENHRFRYNGWAGGTSRYARVGLEPVLARLDPTKIPFAKPSSDDEQQYPPEESHDQQKYDHYELVITPTGISGQFTPF